MTKRRLMQMVLIALVTGGFIAGVHLLYQSVMMAWNKGQLEDLAARSIIRTELATDLAVTTIAQLHTRGLTTCSPEAMTAYQEFATSVGSIKDIRLRSAGRTCAVFSSDGLVADLAKTNSWIDSRNSTIKLSVQSQGNNNALAVLWKEENHDLVTIVSTGGLLFDMVPSALRPYLTMRVSLNNGREIATYQPDVTPDPKNIVAADQIGFSAYSKRYPIQAYLAIDKAALATWNNGTTTLIDLIVCLIGLVIGFVTARALFPPLGAIDEIDNAINKSEFVPYFQPIINLGSSKISGFEMLARWIKPDGEMISPGRFIPLAENFGRIDAMLFSLLRSAGQSIGPLLHANRDLKLTFNVTPEQFLNPGFLPRLLGVVKLAGLPTNSLVAEITERQQLADLELATQVIAQYKEHGIRIAIDDAGTGHNGLSSIQKLDVGTLKLDKIFIDGIVDNERSRQMIELLANLARQYKMNVVAEGIENPAQAAAAHAMGIQEGQGFYFSRPIPAGDLIDLLNEQQKPLVQNNSPQNRERTTGKMLIAS